MLSNSDANNDFIKYYEVKDGKIIIYHKNNKEIRNYSKELEVSVLSKMKQQLNSHAYQLNSIFEDDKSYLIYSFGGIASIGLGFFLDLLSDMFNAYPMYVYGSITFIRSIISYKLTLNKKRLYDDYKKNLLFIENQDLINENLKQFLISEGLVNENTTIAVPLYDVFATINDAHFLNEDEVQDLIDGNINGEMVLRLYKPSI